jgi:hypothetical protein
MRELFPGHYRPEEEEFARMWKDCKFIFDTSALLNLYRYPVQVRDDFLGVMKQISDRVWIPHQVALEYQQNRLAEILRQSKEYDKIGNFLSDEQDKLQGQLRTLVRRHQFIDPRNFLEKVNGVFSEFRNHLNELNKKHQGISDTDQIRGEIDGVFAGQVGKPPQSQDELNSIYEEGKVRYEKKISPGYKDIETKSQEGSFFHNGLEFKRIFGDLILWHQIIAETKTRQIEYVILIIDDDKEDWWMTIDGQTIGPRPELTEEIIAKGGVRGFYMYRSDRFLEFAQKFLNVKVSKESVDQIARLSAREPDIPRTLDHILAVVKEVLYNEKDWNGAVHTVAARDDITRSTVIDQCTRQIGLEAESFRNLLQNREDLIGHLTDYFPEHEEHIIESLP